MNIDVIPDKTLKDCPFCGSKAVMLTDFDEFYVAKCTLCDAVVPRQFLSDLNVIGFETKEQAERAWNRRADEMPISPPRRASTKGKPRGANAKGKGTRIKIVKYLREHPKGVYRQDLIKGLGMCRQTIQNYMNEFQERYPEHFKVIRISHYVLYKWED